MTPVAVTDMANIAMDFVRSAGPGGDLQPLGWKLYDYVLKHFDPKAAPAPAPVVVEPAPVAVEAAPVAEEPHAEAQA
jgi:hypothetical protein